MADNILSSRETEILALIAEGKSNKEIAGELFISVNTVKVHVSKVFQKIGVSSRTEATLYAIEKGIVVAPGATNAEKLETLEQQNFVETQPVHKQKPLLGIVTGLLGVLALLVIGQLLGFITLFKIPKSPATSVISNQRVEQLKDLTASRLGSASVFFEKSLYVFSGERSGNLSGASEKFDLSQQKWEAIADKPTPVRGASAVILRGNIFIPGGTTENGSVTDVFESYNPDLDAWIKKKPLPIGLSDYAITVYEGQIFILGGWDGERYLDSAYRYDPSVNEWFEEIPMKYSRAGASAGVLSGDICVTGGTDANGMVKTMECFDPNRTDKNKSWQTTIKKFPFEAENSLFATTLNNLFAVTANGIWQYSLDTNSWVNLSFKEELPIPKEANTTISSDGYLYLFGGSSEDSVLQKRLLRIKLIYTLSIPNVIN